MAASEPDPTAREIAQRTRSRLPSSQTGSEQRISDALADAHAPELHSLHRRIDGVEQQLNGRIDALDAKIDRLGEHVINRLGDMDAKLDRLLSRTDNGQSPSS